VPSPQKNYQFTVKNREGATFIFGKCDLLQERHQSKFSTKIDSKFFKNYQSLEDILALVIIAYTFLN